MRVSVLDVRTPDGTVRADCLEWLDDGWHCVCPFMLAAGSGDSLRNARLAMRDSLLDSWYVHVTRPADGGDARRDAMLSKLTRD